MLATDRSAHQKQRYDHRAFVARLWKPSKSLKKQRMLRTAAYGRDCPNPQADTKTWDCSKFLRIIDSGHSFSIRTCLLAAFGVQPKPQKMQHESPKAWQCACGFSNRPTNSVCGGTGPLGCKALRSPVVADVDDVEKDGDLPPRRPGTLRLATYNIQFGKNLQQARMPAIAQTLMRTDADIIALQEVTDALLPLLMRYLGADLWQVLPQMPSHPEDMFVFESNYFTALLVRKPLRVFGVGCVPWRDCGKASIQDAHQGMLDLEFTRFAFSCSTAD